MHSLPKNWFYIFLAFTICETVSKALSDEKPPEMTSAAFCLMNNSLKMNFLYSQNLELFMITCQAVIINFKIPDEKFHSFIIWRM